MAEPTSLEAVIKSVSNLMDQRDSVINTRLERLESSLDRVMRTMDSLTGSVDRLLHAQAIGASSSGSNAQMPAQPPSFYQDQQERLKKEEDHLYIIMKVARDEDLTDQIGRHIYFDLVDHDKVKCFRVQKLMHFKLFKEEVAKEFGIPVQFLRFWLWARRANNTYRPNRPLTPLEETQCVGQLREVSKQVHNAQLNLFLEVELGLDLRPMAPPKKTKDDILLFFKLYDPVKEELRYMGRLFVKNFGKPSEILFRLNEMAGYGHEEEILLYEEIRFEPHVMCDPIDKERSYKESQLEDGDIICFQKALHHLDVPSYLIYLRNR